MIRLSGGGGGGGSSVTTNSTLMGTGTIGSPLGVADWPINWFQQGELGSVHALTVNTLWIQGFVLPAQLVVSHIAVNVTGVDATNLYDFGVYNFAGSLVADVGPVHLPSGSIQGFAVLSAPVTLVPGLYIFAWTGNSTTAQLSYDNNIICWCANGAYGTSSGGQLPSTITPLTVSPGAHSLVFALY